MDVPALKNQRKVMLGSVKINVSQKRLIEIHKHYWGPSKELQNL